MGEIDNRRLRDDTPVGAYLKTFASLVGQHEQRKRLKESSFEPASDDGAKGQKSEELVRGLGRVADAADPVPAQVSEAAQAALQHHDLDPSNKIPDDVLFLPLEQQFRLRP